MSGNLFTEVLLVPEQQLEVSIMVHTPRPIMCHHDVHVTCQLMIMMMKMMMMMMKTMMMMMKTMMTMMMMMVKTMMMVMMMMMMMMKTMMMMMVKTYSTPCALYITNDRWSLVTQA